jgi:hypothetical protein
MKVTIEIPDDTSQLLGLTEENAARVLLEDAVAQAYREKKIGNKRLREILGLSWQEKEAFLLRYRIFYEYAPGEIEAEIAAASELFKRRLAEKTAA